MASRVLIHLLLTVVLFHATAAADCKGYVSSGGYKPSLNCSFTETCCGTCDNRYCCSAEKSLTEEDQDACNMLKSQDAKDAFTGFIIMLIVVIVFVIVICRWWRRCWLYNLCRRRRPVVATTATTTTVVNNTQCILPVIQGVQYPAYQPVPAQPAYGGQPYPAQPYAQGPPPQYQTVASPGYPSSQAAPAQAGVVPMPQPTDISK